jgi:mRNA interferase MazF
VVVQAEAFNRSSIGTIVVAVITSNLRLADAAGNIRVSRRKSRLRGDSVVNVSQLFTLDREYLTERVGRLPEGVMREVDAGLRLVLAL